MTNKFYFFTYPFYLNNVKYAIINCKHFLNFKTQQIKSDIIESFSKKYKYVFLEPEVQILKQQTFYRFEKWLNIKDLLSILPNNCFFTLDYPCDMNLLFSDLFIQKTIDNIYKYGYSKNYINTIQFKFMNLQSFKNNYEIIQNISTKCNILGIGNLCRLYRNNTNEKTFMLNLITYIKNQKTKFNWIHIYGLSLRYIELFYNNLQNKYKIISIDSTKWTKACNNQLKLKFGLNCKQENRQEFYNEYLKTIEKRIVSW